MENADWPIDWFPVVVGLFILIMLMLSGGRPKTPPLPPEPREPRERRDYD